MVRRTRALLVALSLCASGCAKTPPHNMDDEEEEEPGPDAHLNIATVDAPPRADAGAVVPPQGDAGPSGGCGSITENGVCAGTTLKYCQNNVVVNQNCSQSGNSCSCTNGYCDCGSSVGPVDDCGGIPYGGTCFNGYLEYCDAFGQPVLVDCWSSGYYCDCDFFDGCNCYW